MKKAPWLLPRHNLPNDTRGRTLGCPPLCAYAARRNVYEMKRRALTGPPGEEEEWAADYYYAQVGELDHATPLTVRRCAAAVGYPPHERDGALEGD